MNFMFDNLSAMPTIQKGFLQKSFFVLGTQGPKPKAASARQQKKQSVFRLLFCVNGT